MARYATDPADARTTRFRRPGRRERVADGAHQGAWTLARIITTIANVVAAIIVAGIALIVFDAHQSNQIVNAVTDAARWLTGPFDGMFTLDSAKWTIAVNWGIAAAVYLAVAHFIANRLAR
jgi:hypothetical protein